MSPKYSTLSSIRAKGLEESSKTIVKETTDLPQLKLYRNRNVLHWTNMPKD
jgi:hypothetical protein